MKEWVLVFLVAAAATVAAVFVLGGEKAVKDLFGLITGLLGGG